MCVEEGEGRNFFMKTHILSDTRTKILGNFEHAQGVRKSTFRRGSKLSMLHLIAFVRVIHFSMWLSEVLFINKEHVVRKNFFF